MAVIRRVIQADQHAITQSKKIIGWCEKRDYVTQELVIQILGNEDGHRQSSGFLKKYLN